MYLVQQVDRATNSQCRVFIHRQVHRYLHTKPHIKVLHQTPKYLKEIDIFIALLQYSINLRLFLFIFSCMLQAAIGSDPELLTLAQGVSEPCSDVFYLTYVSDLFSLILTAGFSLECCNVRIHFLAAAVTSMKNFHCGCADLRTYVREYNSPLKNPVVCQIFCQLLYTCVQNVCNCRQSQKTCIW